MSNVWNYFKKIQDLTGKTTHGECIKCSARIVSNGTSSLKNHARKHGINIILGKIDSSEVLTTRIEAVQPSISSFFSPNNKETFDMLLAKFCAKLGITFSALATKEFSTLFQKAGYSQMISSPNTIKNHVMSIAIKAQNTIKEEVEDEVQNVKLLSVAFDEWTSMANKRYMNVLLFSTDKRWNLGLIRINGSTNASMSNDSLETKLAEFDVSVLNLICMMSDGAAINKSMSKKIGLIQQECLAHGIQLAVKKVLYCTRDGQEEESSDSEDDYESDELGLLAFDKVVHESPIFKSAEVNQLVKKVRQIVRYFNKSPVRNDQLKVHMQTNFLKEKKLIHDSKTRWNSLNNMLTRFYELREAIKEELPILIKRKKSQIIITFSDEEFQLTFEIIKMLTPLEECVRSICRKDCSLYEAHLSVEVALDELGTLETSTSRSLSKFLIEKLKPRFSDFYFVQLYLEDSSLITMPKYFQPMPSKEDIFSVIARVCVKIGDDDEIMSSGSTFSENEVMSSQGSSESSFYDKIAFKKLKLNSSHKSTEDLLFEELRMYDETGHKGHLLQKVLQVTKTIRPTTTDCERAFSVAGYFCNKLRSSLADETLSNLVLLNDFLKRF